MVLGTSGRCNYASDSNGKAGGRTVLYAAGGSNKPRVANDGRPTEVTMNGILQRGCIRELTYVGRSSPSNSALDIIESIANWNN